MKKQKTKECIHKWHPTKLLGENDKYLYRICDKCGKFQRAKLNWRSYEVDK